MNPDMMTFVNVGIASADRISSSVPSAAGANSSEAHCKEEPISRGCCCGMQLLSNLHATLAMILSSELLHRAVFLHGIHIVTCVTISENQQRPEWATVSDSDSISDRDTV